MENKKRRNISALKNNFNFLKLLWKISPARVLLNFLVTLLDFAEWVFYSVIFFQFLFVPGRSFGGVVLFLWGTVAVDSVLQWLKIWFYNVFAPLSNIKIQSALHLRLFRKAQSVDLSAYETPEFYNTYTKAANEAAGRSVRVLSNCAMAVSALFSCCYVIITMARITPFALIFIALPLIGNLFVGKRLGRVMFELDRDSVPARRKMSYVDRVLFFRKYAAELRLTGFFGVLKQMYENAVQNTVEIARQYALKRTVLSGIKSILMFLLGYEGMWLCAAILGLNGSISLSGLIVLLNAIVSVSWMLNNFEGAVSGLFEDAEFLENVRAFFAYEPKMNEAAEGLPLPEKAQTITFKNVSFRYPGQQGFALQNVSLTLHRGQRHALVGVNGSGKSTFVKLLLRFYDPQQGEILLNGVNIKRFNVQEYRRRIGVAFQDFALFSAPVTQNVLLRPVTGKADRELVARALQDAGVYEDILKLKDGLDTVLTREFDPEGAELSGGQRQKIAIARAMAKGSDIIVLDEPSSALDPIAEYKMFETITALCRQKEAISVIVSHRLSSAAVCEQIFVFENGKLAEQGSHRQLLAQNGVYANLFLKQAKNYLVQGVAAYE